MTYDTSTPIYLQVIEIIKKDIVSGKRLQGDKLPSTRELALEMGVNVNTAARIYKELELMGITYTKRGIGTFINESETLLMTMKKDLSIKYIEQFIGDMKGLGYSKEALSAIIKDYEE